MKPTLKQILAWNYPPSSRVARWDRRVLMGVINLSLFVVLLGTVADVLQLNFSWQVSTETPLHLEMTGARWTWLTLDPSIVAPDVKKSLPAGVEPWSLSAGVKVEPKSFASRVLILLTSVPLNGLLFAIIWMVRKIVQTTIGTDEAEGDPFIRANVRRLQIIAALLLVEPLIESWSTMAESELLLRAVPKLPPETIFLQYDLGSAFVFFGVGILVFILAEVFKTGVHLREDVEGLV